MTQRIALVAADGRVVNVIVAGESYTPPADLTALRDATGQAEPGGSWDGAAFAPAPAPPASPSPSKAELLAQLAALQAQIAALPG
jgi:hypothetical protein